MKRIIYLIVVCGFSLSYSCKKCTVCNSYDSAGNIILNEVKTCGSHSDIEKAKDVAKNSGALLGGTYICKDEN